ncbi:metalloprotease, partial [Patellaria atrata CBS 101060]
SVHYERNFNNALWDGTRMIFGDGDGIYFDAFTDSLDVVAHELTHAVTQYTAGLEYSGQSGALNESVSDVFACMAEQWHFRQTSATADWLLGQTLFPVARRGAALRSLKAPGTAYDDEILGRDPQPATMAGYRPLPDDADNDYGGVHLYSGIPNHAFYLVAMALGGNSWEKPGQIWYKTLTGGKIGSRVDFAGFAKVTVEMARMLYGESVALSVKGAWEKVGVLTSANAGR